MRSINFSEDNLTIQWQYVKRNLDDMGIRTDQIDNKAKRLLEDFLQGSIAMEFNQQIEAGWHERSDRRKDIRSGTYTRTFTTTFGMINLYMPKVRKKSMEYRYKLFEKYQRRQSKFDDMVVLSLLLGFSTRKQKKFFQAFIGDSVSHATASKLMMNLSEGLRRYRSQDIEDKYRFLMIDGLWIGIKEIDIERRPILFALGITKTGKKKIIGFKLAKGETEQEYTVFLNDLYRRGLKGNRLELIISDGSKAIIGACNMVYPYTPRQRCYTHKLRNLSSNIRYKRKHRKDIMNQASNIYKAPSRQEAIGRYKIFTEDWKNKEPKAIKCFQDEFYYTLNHYDFHEDIRNVISTTNHIERFLEEIRRRIKIQGYFKNERSLNLWIYGLIKHIELRPIKQMQPKKIPKTEYEIAKDS